MKIGINTACMQKKSHIDSMEIMDFTVENGFEGIEFRDEYPFFENLRTSDRTTIFHRIEKEKLFCSVHLSFYDLNLGSFRKEIRDLAVRQHKDAVKNAADLGAGFVTIHGGHMSKSFYDANQMKDVEKYTSESISVIRETCQDAGIILCIENMSLFKGKEYKAFTNPEQLLNLYEEQNQQIKITFDFGHAVSVYRKPETFITRLGADKISFGHLSDNDFLKDQHLAVGSGSINYISFLETYIKQDWDFPLLIETATVKQTLDSKRYLNEIYNCIKSG